MNDARLSPRLRMLLNQSARTIRIARETCDIARQACDLARDLAAPPRLDARRAARQGRAATPGR